MKQQVHWMQSLSIFAKALKRANENRTTIIIAHRLSTIRKVDRIYVLDQALSKKARTKYYQKRTEFNQYLLKLQFSLPSL